MDAGKQSGFRRIAGGALLVAGCVAIVAGCGGGSDGNGDGNGDDAGDTIPAGKIVVDGHVFNPDFFTQGSDFFAKVAYFDADGRLTSYHDVYEWDGETPTYSYDYRYTYDADGNRVSEEHEFTYTREGLALYNHVFSTVERTYNAAQQVLTEKETIDLFDNDGDGVYDDVEFGTFPGAVRYELTNGYDGNGRLVTRTWDDDGDGDLMGNSSDEVTTYLYDGNGNRVRETTLDGIGITTTLVNEYDVDDRRTRQTRYPTLVRFNADDPDRTTDYFYTVDGRLEREEIDQGVAFTADRTLDGTPDIIIRYQYGPDGDPSEKSTEEIHATFSRTDVVKYLHEVVDEDGNGTPESTVTYVFWLDTRFDNGGGYPPELLPAWYQSATTSLNNGDGNDGWGLNWEGHGSNCSTCGNMIGEINRIIHGF